jgi:ATP-dependent helicase/nuclease subunit B
VQVSFLLGPAGSGKTFRCLSDIRDELTRDPEGKPLVFLAPKQATFQLERQLLEAGELPGFSRLQILSFERLARYVFESAGRAEPRFVSEQGRTMVLRALLNGCQGELSIFGGAARRHGFAEEVARQIREFANHGLTPTDVRNLADKVAKRHGLPQKLRDFALLYEQYRDWLTARGLQDSDALLSMAAELIERPESAPLRVAGLWVDGFAQLTPEERRLLVAVVGCSERATLAFCVEADKAARSPISSWFLVSQTLARCKAEIETRYGRKPCCEVLPRCGEAAAEPQTANGTERPAARREDGTTNETNRFAVEPRPTRFARSPALAQLEAQWGQPQNGPAPVPAGDAVGIYECADPEAEAVCCAREVLRHVRGGGRFREAAVLVRDFENDYPHVLRRVFRRYGIPFFIDHRENVSHHPLAELTRGALRTIAFDWEQRDWFTVLKSGLTGLPPEEIDELENAALARGWNGAAWHEGLSLPDNHGLERDMNGRREKLMTPFLALETGVNNRIDGPALAEALRNFWRAFRVQEQLERWARESAEDAVHSTVWEQMNKWLDDLGLAFANQPLSLKQWIPILEAGLSSLSVGVIPPVLDEVLIGSVDRSRNPDLKLLFIPGFNEKVFPAVPGRETLLTEEDRTRLLAAGSDLGNATGLKLAAEQFYGYIACTRARERLRVSYSRSGLDGKALNPSRFIAQLRRIFPDLQPVPWMHPQTIEEVVHRCELPLLGITPEGQVSINPAAEKLSPETVTRLYGNSLSVSVSALERFASCPFRFFVERGLKVHERDELQLDVREQGSFQHEVLARFHAEATKDGRQWRDWSAAEARELIGRIADEIIEGFRNGLLVANEQNRFTAESYKASLQDFIEVLIGWFKTNKFDPTLVEFEFGAKSKLPGWKVELAGGKSIVIHGRVDRIDVYGDLCVIVDYKSGDKEPNRTLVHHGIQQQLTAYLVAVSQVPEIATSLGLEELKPAGCFYVPLGARYESAKTRRQIARDKESARTAAYTHNGLFSLDHLSAFDSDRGAEGPRQFKYKLKKEGKPYANQFNLLEGDKFRAQLEHAEELIRETGERIFEGEIAVRPYKKGAETACGNCKMLPICRFDSWTQSYNVLTPAPKPAK